MASLHAAMETDEARRLRKRAEAVRAIKRSPEYTLAKEASRARGDSPPCPRTPDPTDLSRSKRQWEASMMRWRRALVEYPSVPSVRRTWQELLEPWPPLGGTPRSVAVPASRQEQMGVGRLDQS